MHKLSEHIGNTSVFEFCNRIKNENNTLKISYQSYALTDPCYVQFVGHFFWLEFASIKCDSNNL